MEKAASTSASPSPSLHRDRDPFLASIPSGGMSIKRDNFTEQPLSPKDERVVSANPSPDAAIIGPSRDLSERPQSFVGDLSIIPQLNAYGSHEQAMTYSDWLSHFGSSGGPWDGYPQSQGYPQYFNAADGLHMSPVNAIYNDNPSLLIHPGYCFNPEMAYGQYSPVATPMPSIMVDGQLYSPQIPISPSLYPQPGAQSIPSSVPLAPSELVVTESTGDNLLFGPGSGYLVHFGTYGGGNVAGPHGSSPITTPGAYPQPMGILGPYEQHVGQRQSHGYGLTTDSSIARYQRGSFGGGSVSYSGGNNGIWLAFDKSRRRERDLDSVYSSDSPGFDRNRGPRASRPKGKSIAGQSTSGIDKDDSSSSDVGIQSYNRPDFATDYKQAKFFIIKSFSEDNVHKSIKYKVWASTPHGNKKLDAAYFEAKEIEGNCPVFLFFSVNASGQFCGVAEMAGRVDFEKNADYWQQDRWSGQFAVHWHIIKDVPNSRFRHILLENNDNKPVTHSRDSQEVKLGAGIEMLKIFKDHDAYTSILDDFDFYDTRERASKERKVKQLASSRTDAPGFVADEAVNQMSGSLAQALRLSDGNKETTAGKMSGNSISGLVISPTNVDKHAVQVTNDASNHLVSCVEESSNHTMMSHPFNLQEGNEIPAAKLSSERPD